MLVQNQQHKGGKPALNKEYNIDPPHTDCYPHNDPISVPNRNTGRRLVGKFSYSKNIDNDIRAKNDQ